MMLRTELFAINTNFLNLFSALTLIVLLAAEIMPFSCFDLALNTSLCFHLFKLSCAIIFTD